MTNSIGHPIKQLLDGDIQCYKFYLFSDKKKNTFVLIHSTMFI